MHSSPRVDEEIIVEGAAQRLAFLHPARQGKGGRGRAVPQHLGQSRPAQFLRQLAAHRLLRLPVRGGLQLFHPALCLPDPARSHLHDGARQTRHLLGLLHQLIHRGAAGQSLVQLFQRPDHPVPQAAGPGQQEHCRRQEQPAGPDPARRAAVRQQHEPCRCQQRRAGLPQPQGFFAAILVPHDLTPLTLVFSPGQMSSAARRVRCPEGLRIPSAPPGPPRCRSFSAHPPRPAAGAASRWAVRCPPPKRPPPARCS